MGNISGLASDEQPGLTCAEKLFYLRNSSQAENSYCVGKARGLVTPGLMAAVFGRSMLLKETFPLGFITFLLGMALAISEGKQQSDFGLFLPVASLSEQLSMPLKCHFGQKEFPCFKCKGKKKAHYRWYRSKLLIS